MCDSIKVFFFCIYFHVLRFRYKYFSILGYFSFPLKCNMGSVSFTNVSFWKIFNSSTTRIFWMRILWDKNASLGSIFCWRIPLWNSRWVGVRVTISRGPTLLFMLLISTNQGFEIIINFIQDEFHGVLIIPTSLFEILRKEATCTHYSYAFQFNPT